MCSASHDDTKFAPHRSRSATAADFLRAIYRTISTADIRKSVKTWTTCELFGADDVDPEDCHAGGQSTTPLRPLEERPQALIGPACRQTGSNVASTRACARVPPRALTDNTHVSCRHLAASAEHQFYPRHINSEPPSLQNVRREHTDSPVIA